MTPGDAPTIRWGSVEIAGPRHAYRESLLVGMLAAAVPPGATILDAGCAGTETTTHPPGRSTRWYSAAARASSATCSSTSPDTTASTDAGGRSSAVTLPGPIDTRSPTPAASALARAAATKSAEASTPITR